MWWLVDVCVVEAWAAWCEYKEQREPLKEFVARLLEEMLVFINEND